MTFTDDEITKLEPQKQKDLSILIQNLCGDAVNFTCKSKTNGECGDCESCVNWSVLTTRLKSLTLSLEDLNDVLLLANQFPLGSAFFNYFLSLGEKSINFQELKEGIVRFQGFALLNYGNTRFAYRTLYRLTNQEMTAKLGRWGRDSKGLRKEYGERRNPVALPSEVPAESTWLLGYIAKSDANRDLVTYAVMSCLSGREDETVLLNHFSIEQKKLYGPRKAELQDNLGWKSKFSDLAQIESKITELRRSINEVRVSGLQNTSHYLASDCMDVYVATSMRERWEFEDVHNTVKSVFSDPKLAKLKLRYFDPTQSFLDNRVDKGLVEALMLKRSFCTVYLIQETDTFGKDSELATTLAQGKPVIAYLPRIDVEKAAKTAEQRPLSYLQKRLSQLAAEGKIPDKHLSEVFKFLDSISNFRPYYRIVNDEESTFLTEEKLASARHNVCGILAEAEKNLFDSRAETLQQRHPLALQVDLQTGVANGVLVVRTEKDCAEVLGRIVENECEFILDRKREPGILSLVEKVSNSPFRVVTENRTLTNAFWSLYNVR